MSAFAVALSIFQREYIPPVMEEETKECIRCHAVKPLSGFYLRITANRPDHYSRKCKKCLCEIDRARNR